LWVWLLIGVCIIFGYSVNLKEWLASKTPFKQSMQVLHIWRGDQRFCIQYRTVPINGLCSHKRQFETWHSWFCPDLTLNATDFKQPRWSNCSSASFLSYLPPNFFYLVAFKFKSGQNQSDQVSDRPYMGKLLYIQFLNQPHSEKFAIWAEKKLISITGGVFSNYKLMVTPGPCICHTLPRTHAHQHTVCKAYPQHRDENAT